MPDVFGAIGDVHCEDQLLEAALAYLQPRVQVTLCVGDLADGVGDFDRSLSLLRKFKVQTVKGNHDRWLLAGSMRILPNASILAELSDENLDWYKHLQPTLEYQTAHGRLLLCHGVGENDMCEVPDDAAEADALNSNYELDALVRSRKYSFMVNGHSHQRLVRRFSGVTVINAGTLKRHQHPIFTIIDIAQGNVAFFDLQENGRFRLAERIQLPERP